jgi:hypothetical protein
MAPRPPVRPIRDGAFDYRDIPSLHHALTEAGQK